MIKSKFEKIKRISCLIICLISVISLCACNTINYDYCAIEGYEGFYVANGKLYDSNNNEFIMRGINHAHAWHKQESQTALHAIKETGSNTVRIALSNGARWQKDDAATVTQLIEICKELKMIAVLEVHDATGRDNLTDLDLAVDYWIEIKEILADNEKFIILNIANEWYGSNSVSKWRDGYIKAVKRLREAGIRNTIMIDAAGWGQYAKSVINAAASVFNADSLKNTMFSVHMYEVAGADSKTVKNIIDKITKRNIPIVIGEFGHKHNGKDVAASTILEYCNQKSVGYLGWSWKGNGDGVEYLDIALDWNGREYSSDWGELLINSEHGISKTSKICTVFDE